jgi:hypothetical protein
MAWSEPLFLCLELLCLLCLGRYLEKGRPIWLAGAAAGVGLACLTRYIGLSFILGGGLVLLVCGALPWRRRLLHLGCFGAAAALPLILWMGRNQALTGTWLGPRSPSSHSLLENLALTCTGLAAFWVPEVLIGEKLVRLGLGGLAAVGLGLMAVWLGRDFRRLRLGLGPVAIWAGGYLFFLAGSSTTTAYDDINLRLLSPLYPAGVVLLLAGAWQLEARGWTRAVRTALVLLLLLPLAGIARAGALYARQGAGAGTGPDRYNTEPWRRSEIIHYLQQHRLEGPVYSNAPDALYILCGQRAMLLPRRGAAEVWPTTGQIVWLDAVRRQYLVGPGELQTLARLQPIARLGDGAIYAILPIEEERATHGGN